MEEAKTQKVKRIYRGWNSKAIFLVIVMMLCITMGTVTNIVQQYKQHKQCNTLIEQQNELMKQNIIIIKHLESLGEKTDKTCENIKSIKKKIKSVGKIYVEGE